VVTEEGGEVVDLVLDDHPYIVFRLVLGDLIPRELLHLLGNSFSGRHWRERESKEGV
jgi:hypothetical protein